MADILVIDDDPDLRWAIRLGLESAGHQVREAADGAAGLAAHAERPAALIVCDLVMPGQEGLETIRELVRRDPAVRILAISGGVYGGTMDFLPLAKQFGAAAVLHKPFGTAELLRAVEAIVGPPAGPQ